MSNRHCRAAVCIIMEGNSRRSSTVQLRVVAKCAYSSFTSSSVGCNDYIMPTAGGRKPI